MLNEHSISKVMTIASHKTSEYKIEAFQVKLKKFKPEFLSLGIDPGFGKFGLATINHEGAFATQFTKISGVTMTDIEKIMLLIQLVSDYYGEMRDIENYKAIVENAAFASTFSVPLAEARTAEIVGLIKIGVQDIIKVPPASIQKAVFGHGRLQSKVLWKDYLPPDASAALTCALYPNFVETN